MIHWAQVHLKDLEKQIKDKSLTSKCKVKAVGCCGLCSSAISVSHFNKAISKETLYGNININDVNKLTEIIEGSNNLDDKKCDITTPFSQNKRKLS